MSQTIDNKVVKMEFDNSQFDSNIDRSQKTLSNFNKYIEDTVNESGNSFDAIDDVANGLSFDGLVQNVATISEHFSAFGVVAKRVLEDVVDSAYNASVKLVKSLSVDNLSAGWQKYTDKTASVQTIMAATGKSIDEVNASLEKLNWFTDETSYNYTDMVNNIGKFTSAGVDLDKAVSAMEGIATEAAVSGQGINEASRAMYNFAQALGVGSVKLMDWKSIENANMATVEFKQTIIDTALEMGTIKEVTEGVYKAIDASDDHTFSVESFSQFLSDAWFTSDVLIETLGQYSAYADKLYEVSDSFDTCSEAIAATSDAGMELGGKAFRAAQEAKTLSEAIDSVKDAVSTGWMQTFELLFGNYTLAKELWTDLANDLWDIFAGGAEGRNDLIGEFVATGLDNLRDKFVEAGLEVADFQMIMDEALMEGGVDLEELIEEYGNFESAMKSGALTIDMLSSELAGMYTVQQMNAYGLNANAQGFAYFVQEVKSANSYSHSLSETYALLEKAGLQVAGNEELINKILDGSVTKWDDVSNSVSSYVDILGEDGVKAYQNYIARTGDVLVSTDKMNERFEDFKTALKDVVGTVSSTEEMVEVLSESGYDLSNNYELIGKVLSGQVSSFDDLTSAEKRAIIYTDEYSNNLRELYLDTLNADGEINQLVDNLTKPSGRELLVETFFNLLHDLMDMIEVVKEAWSDIFPATTADQLYGFAEKLHDLVDGLTMSEETAEKFKRVFKGVFAVLDIGKQIITAFFTVFSTAFSSVTRYSGSFLDIAANIGDFLVKVDETIQELGFLDEAAKRIGDTIKIIVDWAYNLLSISDTLVSYAEGGEGMAGVIEVISDKLVDTFRMLGNVFKSITGININTFIEAIVEGLRNAKETIQTAFTDVGSFIEEKLIEPFLSVSDALDGLTGTANQTKDILINAFGEMASNAGVQALIGALTIISNIFTVIWEVLSTIGNVFVSLIGVVCTGLTDIVGNMDFQDIQAILDTLMAGGIAVGINKIGDIFEDFREVTAGFPEILEGVSDSLEAFQNNLNAKTLKTLATSLIMIAGAMWLLSTIDPGMLGDTLAVVSTLIIELMSFLKTMTSTSVKSEVSMKIMASALTTLSIAIFILAVALKLISTCDPDTLAGSLIALSAMIGEMTAVASYLGEKKGEMMAGIEGIKSLAVAVLILSIALKIIASINPEVLLDSLLAVVGILAALTYVAIELSKQNGKMMEGIGGLIAIAASVMILAIAMKTIASIDSDRLLDSMIAIVILIGALAAVAYELAKQSGEMIKGVGGLIALSVAILILSVAAKSFAEMSPDDLFKAGAAILVLMGALIVFIQNVSDSKGIVAAGIGLVALSASMIIFALAAKMFADMSWEGLGKAALALVAFAEIGVLLAALTKIANPLAMIGVAASLILIGGAMMVMALALAAFGALGIGTIVKGLLTLAVTLAIIGTAGLVLAVAVPFIVSLAVALALIAASVLMVGAGLAAIAAGLMLFTTFTSAAIIELLALLEVLAIGIIDILVLVVVELIDSVGMICEALVAALPPVLALIEVLIVGICDVLIAAIPKILEVVEVLLVGIIDLLDSLLPSLFVFLNDFLVDLIDLITALIPELVELIGVVIEGILTLIQTYTPQIVATITMVLTQILTALRIFIPTAIELIMELILGVLTAISESIGPIVEAASNIIINFLNALTEKVPEIMQAGVDLICALIQGIADSSVEIIDAAYEALITFINGFAEAIETHQEDLNDAFLRLFDAAMVALMDFLTKLGEDLHQKGKSLLNKLWNGIKEVWSLVKDWFSDSWTKIKELFDVEEMKTLGENILNGLWEGLVAVWENIKGWFEEAWSWVIGSAEETFEVHSPSRVFRRIGGYLMEGLGLGVEDETEYAVSTMEGACEQLIDPMAQALQQANDLVSDISANPTITPVVDLSDVESSASRISGLFDQQQLNFSNVNFGGYASLQASRVGRNDDSNIQNGGGNQVNNVTYTFNQTNNSPKALSRIDIYRQTRNQFSQLAGAGGLR